MPPADVDLALASGRLRAWVWGPEDGSLVVCVPGLTANSREFAAVAERLAGAGMRVAALDLRGRGRSDETGPGTYGWPAHAADVAAAARELGHETFDVVGHSMGAFVALQLSADDGAALRRIVLVDAAGVPDADAIGPVVESIARLESEWPSADAFLDAIRSAGHVRPWSALWEDYYRYELVEADDGSVRSRTSHAAIVEDATWGATHDPYALWPSLRVPVLLVRAGVPFGPEGGAIVKASDVERFLADVSGASAVEVDANHYGVIENEEALDAIERFL